MYGANCFLKETNKLQYECIIFAGHDTASWTRFQQPHNALFWFTARANKRGTETWGGLFFDDAPIAPCDSLLVLLVWWIKGGEGTSVKLNIVPDKEGNNRYTSVDW
jgi:coproporphyrinogen III oxidase